MCYKSAVVPVLVIISSHPSSLSLSASSSVCLSTYFLPEMPAPFCPTNRLFLPLYPHHRAISPSTSLCVLLICQPLSLFPGFSICLNPILLSQEYIVYSKWFQSQQEAKAGTSFYVFFNIF